MNRKKVLSRIIAVTMGVSIISPICSVKASTISGVFDDSVKVAEKKLWNGKKYEAKPLVILMDFNDYSHNQIFDKETWNVNGYKKSQKTDYLYSKQYYQDRFFGDNTYTGSDGNQYVTLKKFFEEESGGSYVFNGDVAGWYRAKNNAAYYGSNSNNEEQNNATKLVMEAVDAASKDPNIDLSKYDVEDKWDYDHDGDYHEPDGIVDTLVVIHPGIGEEHGGGSLETDAIWPYRARVSWYKANNFKQYELTDRKGRKWKTEDYTVFSQDLPIDLFGHEYGHVLGLDDLYDTNGSEPPVQYWSLMGGSYTGPIRGTKPNSYGAYGREYFQKDFEKKGFKLNWQNSEEVSLDQLKEKGKDVVLQQSSIKGDNTNAVRVNLPSKENVINKPAEESHSYFSGVGNNLKNSMTTTLDLSDNKTSRLEFITWYDIDPQYDFLSVQVKEQGTDKWVPLKGNLTTDKNPNDETPNDPTDRNPGHAITDSSKGKWAFGRFDLSQFAGKKIDLKFHYWTDDNTPQKGAYIDYIRVFGDNKEIFNDGAEGQSKFKLDGFTQSTGKVYTDHHYLLEWRNSQNGLIDQGLASFPWENWETVKYDAGLAVWYMDDAMIKSDGRGDQNTKEHPGRAFASVVDADQNVVKWVTEKNETGVDKPAFQMHDAAFGLTETSPLNITWGNKVVTVDNSTFMNPVFDDNNSYFNKETSETGVNLPNYGLKYFVTDESKNRSTAKVHITTAETKEVTNQDSSIIQNIKFENNKLVLQTSEEFGDKAHVSLLVNNNGKTEDKNLVLNLNNGVYEANIDFTPNNDTQVKYVILHDKEGNSKALYNINVFKVFGADLTIGKSQNKMVVKYPSKDTKFKVNTDNLVKVQITNSTQSKKKATLMVAAYDKDNRLMKYVKSSTVNFDINETNELSCNANIPNGTSYVKAFIWDDDSNMMPIEKSSQYMVEK